MATRRRKQPGQVVRPLGKSDAMLANGEEVAGVCRVLEISESSFHRRRSRHGGIMADDAKSLKEFEKENATLKRLLADAKMEKAALWVPQSRRSRRAGSSTAAGQVTTQSPDDVWASTSSSTGSRTAAR